MAKKVYIKGQAHYLRPYHKDMGENLEEGSDMRKKLEAVEGEYNALIKLPFSNRDDAEEYLNGLGVPTEGMMGNLLKRMKNPETGDNEIFYKVKRPHIEANFDDPLMGPPKVVDADGDTWNEETLIGNGSECIFKVDVWKGTKATKIRWEAVKVMDLVEYVPEDEEAF